MKKKNGPKRVAPRSIEETSAVVASIASKLLHDPSSSRKVRSVAGSALSQAANRKQKK